MDPAQLSSLNLPIHTLVMFGFYFVLGFYAIYSGVLYYHWKTYATDNKVSGITLILYFSSTIPLLIAMGIMTLIIV